MITIKDFMETVGYRITEGGNYGWKCYGDNAYTLDSWNGDINGHTVSIVFDTKTQEVYEATAYDYSRDRAYRITNPAYKTAHDAECKAREQVDQAWELDDGTPVEYTQIDVAEDFLDKARAIVANEDYDTRIQVPLNLSNDQLFELMSIAHQRDITLNQLVEEVLRQAIISRGDSLGDI